MKNKMIWYHYHTLLLPRNSIEYIDLSKNSDLEDIFNNSESSNNSKINLKLPQNTSQNIILYQKNPYYQNIMYEFRDFTIPSQFDLLINNKKILKKPFLAKKAINYNINTNLFYPSLPAGHIIKYEFIPSFHKTLSIPNKLELKSIRIPSNLCINNYIYFDLWINNICSRYWLYYSDFFIINNTTINIFCPENPIIIETIHNIHFNLEINIPLGINSNSNSNNSGLIWSIYNYDEIMVRKNTKPIKKLNQGEYFIDFNQLIEFEWLV